MIDAEGAETVEIAADETTITVTWIDHDGEDQVRTLDKARDVEKISRDSRRRRGTRTSRPEQNREELLRTLGQELDLNGSHLVRIREIHGFKVSVAEDARRTDHWYSQDELLEKSRARRAHRSADAQPPGAWWHFVRPSPLGTDRPSRS